MKINLKNNTGLKIMSLGIALILWYVIGNINDPVKTVAFSGIPVQIINSDVLQSENKVYEITEGETVAVSVRGKTSIVDSLTADDFTATADFTKLSIVNAVPIDVTVAQYSGQLDISLGRINTLKVNIEDRVEAMLPVVVETEGTPAEGYAIGSKTSSPNMVEISGSKSMIKRLKEIRVRINVQGEKEDLDTRQSVKFYDQNGDHVESPTIACDTAAVDVTVELWKTKEIPVNIFTTGTPVEGYGISAFDYEPKTVEIAADDDKIGTVTRLDLDPLDVTGLRKNLEKTISMDSSSLPNGVVFKNGSVDFVAKAVIEKKVSGEVELDTADITINGLSEGKKVAFDKKKYKIKIDSYESKMSGLTGASFEPYIDVTELGDKEEGELLIHLVNPSGVTVTNTIKAKIKIENQ